MTRKVLVWPGLTELGYEIVESLSCLRFYEVYTASSKAVSLEAQMSRGHFLLPDVTSPDAALALAALVAREGIDILYPAHDDVIVFCRENQDLLGGCQIIAPELSVVAQLRSKHATYKAAAGALPVPDVYHRIDDIPGYPVFSKPDRGQGSQGVQRFDSAEALSLAERGDPDFFRRNVVAELLSGEEYTVDCLSDHTGALKFAAARIRHQIRNGISTDAEIVDLDGVEGMAARISQCFALTGAWFFQLKRAADGQLKLLEIAPRLGGASCLNRMRGINFAHLSILAADSITFEVAPLAEPRRIQRRLSNYTLRKPAPVDAIYVDFDDCLLLHGRLNTRLLALLMHHQGQGGRLVLVSRHAEDLQARLQALRIQQIFDRICHITDPEIPKSAIIAEDMATSGLSRPEAVFFIDDSFRERADVGRTLALTTLDLSMLDLLE